jgi:hypothetical protein
MATNFERCVLNALRALSTAALQALKTALQAFIIQLQGQLAILIAQALPLQLVKTKLEAEAALVAAVSNSIKSLSNILPTTLVDGPCVQLSLMNLSINDQLAPVTDRLDELELAILTAASLVDLNGIQQRVIGELITVFSDLIDTIDLIITEKIQEESVSP